MESDVEFNAKIKKWQYQLDITNYFRQVIQGTQISAYPRMVTFDQMVAKYPMEITDTQNVLHNSQDQFVEQFVLTPEQQVEARTIRLRRVFGGEMDDIQFNDTVELDYEEYRDYIVTRDEEEAPVQISFSRNVSGPFPFDYYNYNIIIWFSKL